MLRADGDFETEEGVTMSFRPDGSLDYCIDARDKRQIMNLVYRVEGSVIVSDQPSLPDEQRTRYEIDSEDHLVLYYDGGTMWLQRTKARAFLDQI